MITLPERPVFYDFEASALDGFPIELGWAYLGPDKASVITESHLIRPAADWNVAESWDERAQKFHKVSLSHLSRYGEPAYRVAKRANDVLAGSSVFSDSEHDGIWLVQLFEAAGLEPAFEVRLTLIGIIVNQLATNMNLPSDDYAEILFEADRIAPQTHRAASDASHWAWVWLLLNRYAAQHN
jgi:hypothetical protein